MEQKVRETTSMMVKMAIKDTEATMNEAIGWTK